MKKLILLLLLLTSSLAAAPKRFIVEFNEPATSRAVRNRFRTDAARVEVRREFSRVFNGAAVELEESEASALARLPYVAGVYEDSEVIAYEWGQVSGVRGLGTLAPPVVSRESRRIPDPRPPIAHAGGAGVVIAIIDTGIDPTHPALAGKVIGGYDFVNDDADPMDDHQHGTHVAGIIVAESPQVTGVATGAKLLAYKVLGANGRGTVSDIIAALDRALDPNGDGNPSDRADIANLSLGNTGTPDDPLSRAVDNAVAAGMVVCVAAGNDETFHRIGSPAGAARAITVGASDVEQGVETLAFFSSRGPATQSGAIKPDVLAPGARILSTGLEHGFYVASGTSMATPVVAGLAALLLEEHPDWTPDRVKAALVTSARALPDEEVMSQGSGVADITRARTNVLVASTTQINFGLDGGTAATFTSTRRISIRNESGATKIIHPQIEGAGGAITVTAPAIITIDPGQTAEFDVTLHVDHATLGKPKTRSFAFGGVIVLDQIRLPWAFVRAGRATLTADGALMNLLWGNDVPRAASATSLGSGGYEILLEPATYDFVIAFEKEDHVHLAVFEQQQVHGDVAIVANPAATPHEVRLAGVDDRGTPFPDGDGETTLYSSLIRLIVPRDFSIAFSLTGRSLHTSSFSDRFALLASEAFVDRAASRVHVAQYEPLRAAAADHVFQVSPGDYAAQEVELNFPSGGARRDITIMPRDWPRRQNEFSPRPPSLKFAVDAPSWRGTFFMTREVHPDFASGVQLSMHTAGDPFFPAAVITPMLRRNANGFFATRGFGDSPLPVSAIAGESMEFGRGAIHIPALFRIDEEGLFGDAEIYGNRGERRRSETLGGKVRVLNENGVEVAKGNVLAGGFYMPMPSAGRFSAEVRVGAFSFDNVVGEATLKTQFDTTLGVASPPAITSLAILNGAGQHATRLPMNGNASLIFSAADHEENAYRRIADSATKVFFRRRNTNTWVQLTAVATGAEETATNLGRSPSGVVYRVDLRDALRLGPGEYELAIEIGDEQGNTTTWQLAPAFIVEATSGLPRRRAVGK